MASPGSSPPGTGSPTLSGWTRGFGLTGSGGRERRQPFNRWQRSAPSAHDIIVRQRRDEEDILLRPTYLEHTRAKSAENPLLSAQSPGAARPTFLQQDSQRAAFSIPACEVCQQPVMDDSSHLCLHLQLEMRQVKHSLFSFGRSRKSAILVLRTTRLFVTSVSRSTSADSATPSPLGPRRHSTAVDSRDGLSPATESAPNLSNDSSTSPSTTIAQAAADREASAATGAHSPGSTASASFSSSPVSPATPGIARSFSSPISARSSVDAKKKKRLIALLVGGKGTEIELDGMRVLAHFDGDDNENVRDSGSGSTGREPRFEFGLYVHQEKEPAYVFAVHSAEEQQEIVEVLKRAVDKRNRELAVEAITTDDPLRLSTILDRSRDESDLLMPNDLRGGETVTHVAAAQGSTRCLQLLVEIEQQTLVLRNHEQNMPIHEACRQSQVESVRALINAAPEARAYVNTTGYQRQTPLHMTSLPAISELLLEVGAEIDARDENGYTPLILAAENGHTEQLAFLIKHGGGIELSSWTTGFNAVLAASANGQLDCLKLLHEHDANNRAVMDLHLGTPLHAAAEGGHLEVISFLLNNGANVDAQDEEGITALCLACRYVIDDDPVRSMDIISTLLAAGANQRLRDSTGRQPLHYCALAGNSAALSLLCSSGAELNALDHQGMTPLEVAELVMCPLENLRSTDDDYARLCRLRQGRDLLLKHGARKRRHGGIPVEHDEDDIKFTKTKTDNSYVVRAATPRRMVRRLTTFPFFNEDDCRVFLAAHPSYISTGELLELIFDRFAELVQARRRVSTVPAVPEPIAEEEPQSPTDVAAPLPVAGESDTRPANTATAATQQQSTVTAGYNNSDTGGTAAADSETRPPEGTGGVRDGVTTVSGSETTDTGPGQGTQVEKDRGAPEAGAVGAERIAALGKDAAAGLDQGGDSPSLVSPRSRPSQSMDTTRSDSMSESSVGDADFIDEGGQSHRAVIQFFRTWMSFFWEEHFEDDVDLCLRANAFVSMVREYDHDLAEEFDLESSVGSPSPTAQRQLQERAAKAMEAASSPSAAQDADEDVIENGSGSVEDDADDRDPAAAVERSGGDAAGPLPGGQSKRRRSSLVRNRRAMIMQGVHLEQSMKMTSTLFQRPSSEWLPEEVAEQLTLEEHLLFSRVRARELLRLAFSKDPEKLAPNYCKLRDFHNHTLHWIVGCILREPSASGRATVMHKFIKVALFCRDKLHNFNAVMEIVSALASGPVYRLKKSRAKLNKKDQKRLAQLTQCTQSDNNYAAMRELLRTAGRPCVPYFGLYLRDIILVEQLPDTFDPKQQETTSEPASPLQMQNEQQQKLNRAMQKKRLAEASSSSSIEENGDTAAAAEAEPQAASEGGLGTVSGDEVADEGTGERGRGGDRNGDGDGDGDGARTAAVKPTNGATDCETATDSSDSASTPTPGANENKDTDASSRPSDASANTALGDLANDSESVDATDHADGSNTPPQKSAPEQGQARNSAQEAKAEEKQRQRLVNFIKMRNLGVIVNDILHLQEVPYLLGPRPHIRAMLHGSPSYPTEDERWERSYELEPREAQL